MPNVVKFRSAKQLARDGCRTALNVDQVIAEVNRQLLIRTRPAVENAIFQFEKVSVQVRRVIDRVSNEPVREIMLNQLVTIEQQIELLRGEAALLPATIHHIIQEDIHVQPEAKL